MGEFTDKIAVVTGGAKGIGQGICDAFASEGARVVCADVDEKAGERLATSSSGRGGEIRFVRADVSAAQDCEAVVRAAVSGYGGVDVPC